MTITKNKNKAFAKEIEEKIRQNDGYCPCSIIKSKDTKCMCKNFREQEITGWCHCKLYYKNMEE